MSDTVRVAAAVLFDAAGRVLIARRPEGKHMAGFWEFPGGKLDAAENAEQALQRELREELGIELRRCHPLLQLRHHYPERVVALEVFVVDEFDGEPAALEGQTLQWVSTAALLQQPLLPADRPIVDAIFANEGTAHGAGHRTAGHSAR
ncbi:MAG TPA: 8-oxo-dGTP diphosphatase MutT [Steroidobacteraceae bacterium]|jgi:8-oxo-dGTP diphosphatase|nr:8-oxo-dGTP diphosphatase MutT [Steroidobacteraceae bacterium]